MIELPFFLIALLVIAAMVSWQAPKGKRLLALFVIIGGSMLCAGVGVGIVFSLPCSAFGGSSFEGACGYGAVFAAMPVALLAFLAGYIFLTVMVARYCRRKLSQRRHQQRNRPHDSLPE